MALPSSPQALYQSWVLGSNRNILAVLEDTPSLRPPVDHLCELLPRLQARYYSIASSSKVHPNSIHICAVVVEYETPTGRTNKGVATNWLKNKPVAAGGAKATVPMYIRKSQFRLPFKATNPEVGETVMFFGCRHKNEDYLYQEELEEAEKNEVLTQLNVAFSRDQEQKLYVQHLLKEKKEHIWKLIHSDNAHIYAALYDIGEELGGLTRPQAVDYIKKLMTKGRYSQDVWT
ncbi:NADPH--cytochrome P450 reductase [Liparis tanakae]|uniref:NADPH--hemoprotein reductase n=1 Tax=Liparis tanakae TaxID=230148 RepID=A0A4Z2EWG3_9TELE|nr:NADPH--cytochrome P450 reductase [Liparis tanakae]